MRSFVVLAASALMQPLAMAAPAALEEIVVVGSHLEDRGFHTGTRLAVDRAALEGMMPAGAEQLLQRLPGVSVYRPGGAGGVSEVFLRGAESNFTAVYVDGVRMNNPANNRGGSFDWSTMAVNEIERIDVAVGSMSAIHGSDAMAGVVRIETAWPQPGQVAAYTEIGSDQAWRAGVAGSLGVGETASAGVRVSTLDAGTAIEGSRLELDSFAARLAGVHHGDDAWRLGVRVIDRRRSSYPEVSGGPRYAVLDALEHADGSEVGLSGSGEWTVAERWQTELAANWRRLEDDSRTPPVAPGLLDGQPGYTSDSEHERAQLQWINRVGLGADSGVAFGLDVVEEDGRDDGSLDLGFAVLPNTYRMERSTRSGFLEWGHAWPAGFSSTLALRRDGGTEESRSSGALGLARAFGSVDGRAWARVANGFKLPSFFALGNPLYGNPDLEPEQVRSVELGYDQTFGGRGTAGVSVFRSEFEDLVDFDFETFRNVNRGGIDVDGVYLYAQFAVAANLRLAIDATLLDIRSASGPLRRRPENTGGIHLGWQPSALWSVDAALRYVDERLITSVPTGDVTDGAYLLADATVRFRAAERVSLWFAIDNALDTDYSDAPGFAAPGIQARLGTDLRF